MGHRIPYSLPCGHGSIAFFAEEDADRLIVFVHGFGGKALKTWKGMEKLLQSDQTRSSDVVFYGYGSLAAPARNSATLFRDFLNSAAAHANDWRSLVQQAGASPGGRNYKDILIVAHSLGAVVVRRALLDAIEQKASWAHHCRLLLFGPAHMGTRLIELQQMLKSKVFGVLSDLFTFARIRVPVLDDLKEGSPFLGDLLSESEKAMAAGWEKPLKAQAVIFGERDYVVRTDRFGRDPLSLVWRREDHSSVCCLPETCQEVVKLL